MGNNREIGDELKCHICNERRGRVMDYESDEGVLEEVATVCPECMASLLRMIHGRDQSHVVGLEESQRTIECGDCFNEVELPENVAVLKCPFCDGLLPIDDRAAELLAEGIGNQWAEASREAQQDT